MVEANCREMETEGVRWFRKSFARERSELIYYSLQKSMGESIKRSSSVLSAPKRHC